MTSIASGTSRILSTSNDPMHADSQKTLANSTGSAKDENMKSRLLSLPGELRNEIYRLVTGRIWLRRSELAACALLQVCSQIREEVSSILYGESCVLGQVEGGDHRYTTDWVEFMGKDLARKMNYFHVNYLISPEEIDELKKVAGSSWYPAEIYQKHLEYSAFLLVEQLQDLGVRTSVMQGRYDFKDPEQEETTRDIWWATYDLEDRWNDAVIAFGKAAAQPEREEA